MLPLALAVNLPVTVTLPSCKLAFLSYQPKITLASSTADEPTAVAVKSPLIVLWPPITI